MIMSYLNQIANNAKYLIVLMITIMLVIMAVRLINRVSEKVKPSHEAQIAQEFYGGNE